MKVLCGTWWGVIKVRVRLVDPVLIIERLIAYLLSDSFIK